MLMDVFVPSIFAQDHQAFGSGNPSVMFNENSILFGIEQKAVIDTFFKKYFAVMKDNDTTYFFKNRSITLQSYTSIRERKKNNLIGMARCVAILDYIESKYHIKRDYFLIVDASPIEGGNSYVYFFFTRK